MSDLVVDLATALCRHPGCTREAKARGRYAYRCSEHVTDEQRAVARDVASAGGRAAAESQRVKATDSHEARARRLVDAARKLDTTKAAAEKAIAAYRDAQTVYRDTLRELDPPKGPS